MFTATGLPDPPSSSSNAHSEYRGPTMRLRPNVTLWPHQERVLGHLINTPRTLLRGEPGIGKTLTALAWLCERSGHGDKRFLVIVPKSALGVWGEDFARFVEGGEMLILNKGNSTQKQREVDTLASGKPTVVVVNYATAKLLRLRAMNWDVVIADESHYLKSHNSQTSRLLAVEFAEVPRKLAMTGTPFSDRPTDVYGQVRWLWPRRVPLKRGGFSVKSVHSTVFGTWMRFFNEYVQYTKHDHIPIVTGYKNQGQMARLMQDFYIEVNADDVLDLPEVIERVIPVKPTRYLQSQYDLMRDENVMSVTEDLTDLDSVVMADNPLVRELRLHQLTSGYWQPMDPETPAQLLPKDNDLKLKALQTLLEDELGGVPLVVFTRFRHDVKRIRDLLDKLGKTYRELTGEVDNHSEWREGEAQVLIANLQAGAAGVRLERACHVVYYGLVSSRSNYVQSRARVRRPGQKSQTVWEYYIVMEGTVDELMLDRMRTKAEHEDSLRRELNGE